MGFVRQTGRQTIITWGAQDVEHEVEEGGGY